MMMRVSSFGRFHKHYFGLGEHYNSLIPAALLDSGPALEDSIDGSDDDDGQDA